MVDYNLAFKKPFSDFRKLIIGIVINIIPIVNLISYGYILESSDIKRREQSDTMSEWEDFSGFFIKGLLSFIIILIYSIPVIIVGAIVLIVGLVPFLSQVTTIGPLGVQMEATPEIFSAYIPNIVAIIPLLIILLVLLLIVGYITPVAVLNYIKSDNFSEAFNFSQITKYIFTGDYIIVWLLSLVLNMVLVGLLSEIPILGTAIGSFISGMIGTSLIAGAMISIDKKN